MKNNKNYEKEEKLNEYGRIKTYGK
jgi:hypothetical protein